MCRPEQLRINIYYHKGGICHEPLRGEQLIFRYSGRTDRSRVFYRLSEDTGTFSFYLIRRQHQFNCLCGNRHFILSFVPAFLPHILLSGMQLFTAPCSALSMFHTVFNWNTALFNRFFFNEGNLTGGVSYKYIWHNLPCCLSLSWPDRMSRVFQRMAFPGYLSEPGLWFLFYSGLTMLMTYTFYTPNIFGRSQAADTAHGHAYFNSVYNVFHGSAYTESTTSIYGHYALFINSTEDSGRKLPDFMLITALIGGLCFLCSFLTLHLMVENTVIRILGCIATLPILSM
ncbi:hypothetical protein MCG44_00480, partial [Lawsonibacter sp. OA9]|uniref:hypothetical protein n=1 Tax=Lawsonibacter sp. OA9 TaxID=2914163 RepID=UPI001F054295